MSRKRSIGRGVEEKFVLWQKSSDNGIRECWKFMMFFFLLDTGINCEGYAANELNMREKGRDTLSEN